MLVSDLAHMGIRSFYYWGTGSLLITGFYFIRNKEWSKRNEQLGMLDDNSKKRKVLLRTWDNAFCWKSAAIVFFFAGYEMAIVSIIILTMQFSH